MLPTFQLFGLLACQIPASPSYITVPLGRHPAERARAGLRAGVSAMRRFFRPQALFFGIMYLSRGASLLVGKTDFPRGER